MGPGTGLGAAQLMWDTGMKAYKVWPGKQDSGPGCMWARQQLQRAGKQQLVHVSGCPGSSGLASWSLWRGRRGGQRRGFVSSCWGVAVAVALWL